MIAHYLVMLLSREESCWQVPAMAFLVEVILMASSASLSCLLTLYLPQPQLWGVLSVELRQSRDSALCPWSLTAGVTLPPLFPATLVPPLTLPSWLLKVKGSEAAKGWRVQQSR